MHSWRVDLSKNAECVALKPAKYETLILFVRLSFRTLHPRTRGRNGLNENMANIVCRLWRLARVLPSRDVAAVVAAAEAAAATPPNEEATAELAAPLPTSAATLAAFAARMCVR